MKLRLKSGQLRGTPPQEGDPPQKGDRPPHEGGGPPSRVFFSLCITIYRRKNQIPKLQKATMMMSMKVHVSSLHHPCHAMHEFIEISICALEKNN